MLIKIITCHDVYNAGASLQAYALMTYLNSLGHETSIIDYKPEYLSRHYRLDVVHNPVYDKPIIKQLYLLYKLPRRLKALRQSKKKDFDTFKSTMLKCTSRTYHSLQELEEDCPKADVYIAGSDQIWNPLFDNGKDPAFFLDFVHRGKKIAYAASFSVTELSQNIEKKDKEFLSKFYAISVRESSGITILKRMGIEGSHVLDPIFLVSHGTWSGLCQKYQRCCAQKYVFVYDFDSSDLITKLIHRIKKRTGYQVISYFPREDSDCSQETGPIEFLSRLKNAEIIISNSYHATAFAVLFHKEFYCIGRNEAINSRILDFLKELDLSDRFLEDEKGYPPALNNIAWDQVDIRLSEQIVCSKDFINKVLA